ncbi:MAG: class I SAM-dependent methyltransferase [bacterium]|nr:class I SAM-dependent methyltransferase [bacterium]
MAEHVCPVWVGRLLISPLRKLFQNPIRLLAPHVQSGMTTLDVGCAMGFFSLPLAEMVGEEGKVVCVDLQPEMIAALKKRASRARLSERLETIVCTGESLELSQWGERIDFALAYAVVHEVPDATKLFAEIYGALKADAKLLIVEPGGHVSTVAFDRSVNAAERVGFKVLERKDRILHRALLGK